MSTINHKKTAEIIRQMKEINISGYDLYMCVCAMNLETTMLMFLVDSLPMSKIEEIVQHKKEDWG